ncbi:unnamed protein product [Staurois parvus]|uniref:Uncharacterized protein n=1 Tax=Staurois parvus TaxID=386267 RepID=A0ABN9EUR0_9NEOB|nr:unnamed protein product [Staurois parvus]
MEGIGTPESHDLEGGPNTFGNIVPHWVSHLGICSKAGNTSSIPRR